MTDIELTPLRVDDADEMAVVLAADELYTFTGGTPPTVDELRERYRRQVVGHNADGTEQWFNWIVRRTSDGHSVGYVQATVTGDTAEIAWVIGTQHQGYGYATTAAEQMAGQLGARGVARIVAHIHPDHLASNAVARRLGMRPTDEFEDGERRWTRP